MSETLGQRIKRLRESYLNQAELARAMGVKPVAACEWESDQSKPSIDRLPRLADLLGVSVDYLLTGKESQPRITVTCWLCRRTIKREEAHLQTLTAAKVDWRCNATDECLAVHTASAPQPGDEHVGQPSDWSEALPAPAATPEVA